MHARWGNVRQARLWRLHYSVIACQHLRSYEAVTCGRSNVDRLDRIWDQAMQTTVRG